MTIWLQAAIYSISNWNHLIMHLKYNSIAGFVAGKTEYDGCVSAIEEFCKSLAIDIN